MLKSMWKHGTLKFFAAFIVLIPVCLLLAAANIFDVIAGKEVALSSIAAVGAVFGSFICAYSAADVVRATKDWEQMEADIEQLEKADREFIRLFNEKRNS